MYNLEMEQNMKWVQICKRIVKQYYSHLISTYIGKAWRWQFVVTITLKRFLFSLVNENDLLYHTILINAIYRLIVSF